MDQAQDAELDADMAEQSGLQGMDEKVDSAKQRVLQGLAG